MTYEEFKELIEREDGFQVIKDGNCHKITNKEGRTLVLIGNTDNYTIDTLYSINETDICFLANNWHTISTYISTPVEDRFPVKKYYVKLNIPDTISSDETYLNRYTNTLGSTYHILHTKGAKEYSFMNYQTQFTMEEIKEIIPKEDMDKFKLIPVEEEK